MGKLHLIIKVDMSLASYRWQPDALRNDGIAGSVPDGLHAIGLAES